MSGDLELGQHIASKTASIERLSCDVASELRIVWEVDGSPFGGLTQGDAGLPPFFRHRLLNTAWSPVGSRPEKPS